MFSFSAETNIEILTFFFFIFNCSKIAQEYLTASCNVDIEDIPDDLAPGPLAVALNRANSDQYLHLLQLCAAGTQHYVARCEK